MIRCFRKKTSNIPVDNGSSLNRIQAIRALEVRVTALSTSKIHAIKKIKKNTPLRLARGALITAQNNP
jgi:hypothetical protein